MRSLSAYLVAIGAFFLAFRSTGVASACCEAARREAGSKCWNDWCVGCCKLWPCDAACAVGDYFCVCGVTGQSCTPPC